MSYPVNNENQVFYCNACKTDNKEFKIKTYSNITSIMNCSL